MKVQGLSREDLGRLTDRVAPFHLDHDMTCSVLMRAGYPSPSSLKFNRVFSYKHRDMV